MDAVLALLLIQIETEEVALTPRSAWSAVMKYLLPLLPSPHKENYRKWAIKSWADFHFLYANLLGECRDGDLRVLAVANGIEAVFKHSTRPPRALVFPQFIEVTYFLNSCDHLKLPIRSAVAPDHLGNAEVFRFCKFCWRIALPNRQACPIHSAGKNFDAMVLPPVLNLEATTSIGRHKEGARQKGDFDRSVLKVLTQEIMEFHSGGFEATVLFPDRDWTTWLVKRRPNVWSILEQSGTKSSYDQIPQSLVNLLHNPENLSSSLRAGYLYINQLLVHDTRLMWPMLLRAECWVTSRQARKKSWGGTRKKST